MGHFITKIHFYLGEDQEAPVIGLEETHAQDQKNVAKGKNFNRFFTKQQFDKLSKNKFYVSNFLRSRSRSRRRRSRSRTRSPRRSRRSDSRGRRSPSRSKSRRYKKHFFKN